MTDSGRVADEHAGEDGDTDSDWGFSSGRQGMSKETKIGLFLITVLLCAVGFVLYKKLDKNNAMFAAMQNAAGVGTDDETNSGKTTGSDEDPIGQADPEEDRRVAGRDAFGEGQSEPEVSTQVGRNSIPSGQIPNPSYSATFGENNEDGESWGRQRSNRQARRDDDLGHGFDDDPQQSFDSPADPLQQATNRRQDNSQFAPDNSPFGEPDRPVGRNSIPSERITNPSYNGGNFGESDEAMQADGSNPQQEPVDERNEGDPGFTGSQGSESGSEDYGQRSRNRFDGGDRDEFGNRQETSGSRQDADGSRQATFSSGQDEFGNQSEDDVDEQDGRYGPFREVKTGQAQARSTTVVRQEGSDMSASEESGQFSSYGNSTESELSDRSQKAFGNPSAQQSGQNVPFGEARLSSKDRASSTDSSYGAFQSDAEARVYVVRPNDNYWTISKKEYGTARYFAALARYNRSRIPDPRRMRTGMNVLIPDPEILKTRFPDLFPHQPSHTAGFAGSAGNLPAGFFIGRTGERHYRIGARDTLTEIARRHLGRSSRWAQIYAMNRDRLKNPNDLKIGTVLRLPADASRVSMAPK